jgi:hypothetical protein
VKTLISDEDGVFAKFEVTIDVDPTTVEEVENLGDHEGIGETETDEGRVTEESGAD